MKTTALIAVFIATVASAEELLPPPEVKRPAVIRMSSRPAVETERQYQTGEKAGFLTKGVVRRLLSDGTQITEHAISAPVLFAKNSPVITGAQNEKTLAEVAAILAKLPEGRFRIEGHASAEGDPVRNQTLSGERAASVLADLVKRDLSSGNITSRGFGSAFAKAAADAQETERAKDRRVLIIREK